MPLAGQAKDQSRRARGEERQTGEEFIEAFQARISNHKKKTRWKKREKSGINEIGRAGSFDEVRNGNKSRYWKGNQKPLGEKWAFHKKKKNPGMMRPKSDCLWKECVLWYSAYCAYFIVLWKEKRRRRGKRCVCVCVENGTVGSIVEICVHAWINGYREW